MDDAIPAWRQLSGATLKTCRVRIPDARRQVQAIGQRVARAIRLAAGVSSVGSQLRVSSVAGCVATLRRYLVYAPFVVPARC
jgi:hypothetical protein